MIKSEFIKKGEFIKNISLKNIIIFVVSIFVIWNISWFLITTIKYHKFVEVIPKNEFGVHVKEKDDYLYNVKKPGYLHFTGNLGVAKTNSMDGLIIWPLLFGGYEYGIRLQNDGEVFEIYVDENMKPIDKEDKVAVQQVEENKDEIEKLISKANEIWNLE
ncbi:hypothetical protein [Cytobacillus sp. NCCP-133]|uniref:hypothetical protein n=1 Tax=Cytobacillus sp. NCCP-133 TaxID=766848 RepID=UPI002231E917|nr:hypothetical protein [Cytobacillus sp. NCCP-133]GLB61477.1 hypothetical protein NCCP133_36060 [Cytobacillus sp. NCCP-133]